MPEPLKMVYEQDAPLDALQGKTVAVIGFGSQGHAHAQNLRESGIKVIVANRKDSANGRLAIEKGFDPVSVDDAVKAADLIIVTLPDEVQPDVYEKSIAPHLKAGFETLTEAGYPPEMAYFECVHEVKLIVDLIYQGGLDYMRYSISNTAEWGDLITGPKIVTADTKAAMKKVLTDIQDGTFAKNFRAEYEGGMKEFKRLYEADNNHPVEVTGRQLRGMMSWLNAKTPPKD